MAARGVATDGRSIYFDLTDVLEYARHHERIAGIPRVSLRIIGHLIAKHGRDRIKLVAWHRTKNEAFELDSSWCTPDYEYDQREFDRWFDVDRGRLQTIRTWAEAHYPDRPLRRVYHMLRAQLFAILGRDDFFRARDIDLPHRIGDRLRRLAMKPGDEIVIMGAVWNFENYMRYLDEQKRAGVRVHLFVHDLIPVVVPEHAMQGVPQHFAVWLDTMSRLAAAFLTNSESTRRDLQVELDRRGARQPIRPVRLAHQFVASGTGSGLSAPIRASVLSSARLPFVLFVGTLESRKNPWGLARVWARLIDDLGFKAPRLVMAGGKGWLKEDFDDYMHGSGNLNGFIRFVERPSEDELSYLYSRCLFTVLPSFYEGWGLPIGESLWFGKTCVTSNVSAMPEVGGDMCAYVDPNDLESLYQGVHRMVVDEAYRAGFERRITRDRLRTWERVADDLWSAVTECDDGSPGT